MTACPVCALPLSDSWLLLASKSRGEDPVETRLCPGCTVAVTGEVVAPRDAAAGYRARACTGPSASMSIERDDGTVAAPTIDVVRDRLRERIVRLRGVLQQMQLDVAADVLDVGSRDGVFLATAAKLLPVSPVALEPWQPWRRAGEHKGLPTLRQPIETWGDQDARFDVITDFDVLGHVPDPIAHLEAIARHLRPEGVAIIEVPNLLGAAGKLDQDILRVETPWTFTPRALFTACRRAGLMPVTVEAAAAITMVCRRADKSTARVAGPDALKVAHLAWGNDLRLSAKRTLARNGASPRVVRGVARIHKRCPIPEVRADLAIEIATALERCGDYAEAATWLRTSLQDRHDPEVVHLVQQLAAVQHRINHALVAGAPHGTPSEAAPPALAA